MTGGIVLGWCRGHYAELQVSACSNNDLN